MQTADSHDAKSDPSCDPSREVLSGTSPDSSCDTHWLEVRVVSSRQASDTHEDWLFQAGALSVTLSDGIDDEGLDHAVLEPAPGEVLLWDELVLVGLFAQGSAEQIVRDALSLSALSSGLAVPDFTVNLLQDQIWERSWMDSYKPMRFGHRLWICPSESEGPSGDAVTIKLDPGMAFGTGTHATTAHCLHWLGEQTDTTLAPLKGKIVVDYGCGSGVLAIAALLLGAEHAYAVDIDPQALLATTENAKNNGVSQQISVGLPDILDGVHGDIVLANILFQPLLELAETLTGCVREEGTLLMSGILEEQIQPLCMRYNPHVEFISQRVVDGWALVVARQR